MKKQLLTVFLCVALLMMTACQSGTNTPDTPSQAENTGSDTAQDDQASDPITQATEPVVLNDDVTEDNDDYYVNSVEAESEHESIAYQYVTDILAGNVDKVLSDYTLSDEMKDAVNADTYQQFKDQMDQQMGKLVSIFDLETTHEQGYEVVNVNCEFDSQKLTLKVVFDTDGKIAGFNSAQYSPKSLMLYDDTILEKTVIFGEEGYRLQGVITTPKDQPVYGVVILVHGSGASDRNETIAQNEPFKDLAWGLAKQGIATFRYDKRTYSYNQKLASDNTLTPQEEVINDVTYAEQYLNVYTSVPLSNLYVLGHSLGGYLIPAISDEMNHTRGYIFLSANSSSIGELAYNQYSYIYNLDGELSDQEEKSLADLKKEIDKLTPDSLAKMDKTDKVLGAYKAYWEYLANYHPLTEVESMTQPMLFLQGENDYQVPLTDFEAWKTHAPAENSTFISYPNLNHLLMYSENPSTPDDYYTKNHVDDQVTTDIADWIKGQE